MSVSFLVPSRKRANLVKRSIESIISTYRGSIEFDILVRLDFDEADVADQLKGWCLERGYNQVKIFVGGRFFYENIHYYYNQLSFLSTSKWLWLWNDENIMTSIGWDHKIKPFLGKFQFLFPKSDACFHLSPRKLVDIIGYYSPTTSCDSWQGHLATLLGRVQYIDIDLIHDRYDLTGNNNDETYQERNYVNNTFDKIWDNKKELALIDKYLQEHGELL